jgi:hypothetical protein
MRCSSLAAHTTLRHDILKGILRRVVHRAGTASTQEPALRRLPGLAGGARISASGASTLVEAQGDILPVLPGGITIADISMIHPLSINTLSAAAATAGRAASRRDQQTRAAYARVEPNGYPFVPFSVESYGRLGQPAMKLLHALGDEGPVGSSGHPLLQALCASLALGCVGAISSCTVRVWECLQSPVGRGSGLAFVCPLTSMGCCRVPAGYVLFVPVLFM